ncbi:hypothetical protein Tco_0801874 [Tanacetum coccineum]|uniref:Uncharacterized protein n=1 Tax=Tanacetum coccineum TaxID=301880 RepID=A0ABQ4ZZY0_9ASTR
MEHQKAAAKAEAASLKAKPSYPDINQLTTLLVTSLKPEIPKLLASHDFASCLPTELKELPSKVTELSVEIKELKQYVKDIELELLGDLQEIPSKLKTFTSTISSLSSQVAELKNIQWELPTEFHDLPHLVYREDRIAEVIENFKVGDLQLAEWRERSSFSIKLFRSLEDWEVSSLQCMQRLRHKFKGDNTPIIIQPPCYSVSKIPRDQHFISGKFIKVLTMNSRADLKDLSESFQIEVEFLLFVHSKPVGSVMLVDRIPKLVHVNFWNICNGEKCIIAQSKSKSIQDNLKCGFSLSLSRIDSPVAFSNLQPFLLGNKFKINFGLLSSNGRYDSAKICTCSRPL